MLDGSTIGMIVALVVCVALSAFFSASETAFSSLNKIRLKAKAEAGDARAARTLEFAENYDELLSTILIGNNIVNIAASSLGTVLFTIAFKEYGPTVSTVALTVIILIFGEISPKGIAKENAEMVAVAVTAPLKLIRTVFHPLNILFMAIKRFVSAGARSPGTGPQWHGQLPELPWPPGQRSAGWKGCRKLYRSKAP